MSWLPRPFGATISRAPASRAIAAPSANVRRPSSRRPLSYWNSARLYTDRSFAGRGHNVISAGNGDDYVAAGPKRNAVDAGAGHDVIRFPAMHRGPSSLDAGSGDDIVHAYGRGPIRIACGPGDDTVRISFNRLVRTARDCEHVSRRYKG